MGKIDSKQSKDASKAQALNDEQLDKIAGGKEGMAHPSTKPVLTGAAVGAAAR